MTKILKPRDFEYKTEPYKHQETAFNLSREKEVFGLFMEQGTGKTKVALDSLAYQYDHGEIDAAVVLAPNGVHKNWADLEIPCHMVERARPWTLVWTAARSKTVGFKNDLAKLAKHDGLAILSMNVESLSRKKEKSRAYQVAKQFLNMRRASIIMDESTRIKTPSAMRTRNVVALGKEARSRRILTGTPWTNSPFDIYAPFRFLDPEILGFSTFTVFKHYFGVWEKRILSEGHGRLNREIAKQEAMGLVPDVAAIMRLLKFKPGKDYFDELVHFANLDEMKELVAPHVYRITKDECLDLPPKIFQRLPVELNLEQLRMYNSMAKNLVAYFDDKKVVASIVLVKILRLQQIVGGFLPVDDPEHEFGSPIGDNNPKIEGMLDILEDIQGRVIIWAYFRAELQAIADALRDKYGKEAVVEYHGGIDENVRDAGKRAFQDPESPVRFFVSNPQSGGIGLTLTKGTTQIFFSHKSSLELRKQAEDRSHRIGTENETTFERGVVYIDIEAEGTVDQDIVSALQAHIDIANYLTGDTLRKLIRGELFDRSQPQGTA